MSNMFMGREGFYWFFGVVEDNGDPMALGRCRIRVSGWHNADIAELETSLLPWAYPITPITNPAVSGIGVSAIGPLPGTTVFGFFLDGDTGQQPVMIGTVPGGKEYEYRRKIENGSTPWQPSQDKLINATAQFEGDCPTGYDTDNTTTNQSVPDPRDIDINPDEWSLPCTGFVSSAYNDARGIGTHNGVDICPAGFFKQEYIGASHLNGRLRGPVGQSVYAAAAGTVSYIWTADRGQKGVKTTYDSTGAPASRSFGNAIAIKHSLAKGTWTTIYAHLGQSQDASEDLAGAGIDVSVGQSVAQGEQIGTMGRSHVYDSLTHLHFEIREGATLPRANNHINPARIFPQLISKHTSFVSWANSQTDYAVDSNMFNKHDAPVQAKGKPRV